MSITVCITVGIHVRVHHPLKQGLRHIHTTFSISESATVRVHHPLKQGLRLVDA